MSGRAATPQQRVLLDLIDEGKVNAHGGHGGLVTYYLADAGEYVPVTAAVERLWNRGWVDYKDEAPTSGAGVADIVLTPAGQAARRKPPQAGQEFTHKHMLDPWWQPGPGERYIDAPHARMVITKVTAAWVYHTYANANPSVGTQKIPRDRFEREYPTPEEA